jgi:predicted O-methyltransferase YrrM
VIPLSDWIGQLFQHRELLLMGHAQRRDDLNLGLGWLYYALGRALRPANAVVIGSFRGFVPMVLARSLADNSEGGRVHFIDPSYVDAFWKDKQQVRDYFAGFGVTNITHHPQTTQQFVASPAYGELDQVGIVFVDGYHSAEQARFDFDAFADKLSPDGMILLHDSISRKRSTIYGPDREYVHSVLDFVADLKRNTDWQVFDFPFGDGLTIVRRACVPARPAGRQCAAAVLADGCIA